MALSSDELEARLAAITKGPWERGLVTARQELAPVDRVRLLKPTGRIALDGLVLSPSNKRKSRRLSKVLRAHFEGEVVDDEKEIRTRDALDEALTLPQLLELAVQAGYLPEDAIRKPARRLLTDLLWAEPARRFVLAYDYIAIPMLASRVDVTGFATTKPPEPDPSAALHFAGFLAHLRAFHTDEHIDVWLGFLDDYVEEEDEQNRLWEYLREKRPRPPRRAEELLAGCQAFVASLSSAFDVLSESELGPFGLMHAYWLQKFLGYERDPQGLFVKDTDLWGKSDSWASTMSTSPRLAPPHADAAMEQVIRDQFVERVQLLERTFDAVRALAQQAQSARAGAPAGAKPSAVVSG